MEMCLRGEVARGMPSSLIVVGLVVAWLVVLVPMIVRKRQEIARTADSALAARVVHSGGAEEAEEEPMRGSDEPADEAPEQEFEELPPIDEPRRYRPGRGGYDPEAAAVIARAKYGFRQRVVLAVIVGSIVTGVFAGVVFPMLWWAHGMLDITLVSYLVYLRRQVRIEQEIRERRLARMRAAQRIRAHQRALPVEQPIEEEPEGRTLAAEAPVAPPRVTHPGTTVVDVDDEDPYFDELDTPDHLRYRRAVGE
jgi:hypothetical protein